MVLMALSIIREENGTNEELPSYHSIISMKPAVDISHTGSSKDEMHAEKNQSTEPKYLSTVDVVRPLTQPIVASETIDIVKT